jgi:hypothetical protein
MLAIPCKSPLEPMGERVPPPEDLGVNARTAQDNVLPSEGIPARFWAAQRISGRHLHCRIFDF